ncbi:MAG: acetolactate decarboxylase [Syntrophales bacterium]|nr:acetolactate decarboxylase [Syntrophales bacterium]
MSEKNSRPNSVYISTPINVLVEGYYEQNITIGDLRTHGDFGLGTFNDLDGEMVVLDGVVYQIAADGTVVVVADDVLTPFACVTFYQPETLEEINEETMISGGQVSRLSYEAFQSLLDRLLPSPNMLYAIRIDGRFSHVRTRSPRKQENYRLLVEATKDQAVFDFHDISGTISGFYTPLFMPSLNVPGYHLHFISDDRRQGGHLLSCTVKSARIGLQHIALLEVALPVTLDYLTADLSRDTRSDLRKAEQE